jgi:hypothetical protein
MSHHVVRRIKADRMKPSVYGKRIVYVDPKQCTVYSGSILGHLHEVVFDGCFLDICYVNNACRYLE